MPKYPAKMKAKARLLVEKGESLRTVAAALSLDHKTVLAWSNAGKWEKGALGPVLEQKERDSAMAYAEKAGLTKALVAETAAKLCKAQDVMMRGPMGVTRFPVPDGKLSRIDEDGNKTVAIMGVDFELVDDRRAMKDGATLGADILGMKKADQETERANDNLINLIRSFKPK